LVPAAPAAAGAVRPTASAATAAIAAAQRGRSRIAFGKGDADMGMAPPRVVCCPCHRKMIPRDQINEIKPNIRLVEQLVSFP
jgi:hypothetical protein